MSRSFSIVGSEMETEVVLDICNEKDVTKDQGGMV